MDVPVVQIPASTLWLSLQTIQPLSGAVYPTLLQNAGLETWHPLPPSPPEGMVPAASLTRLYRAVFDLLGEPAMRLFLRNCGMGYWRVISELPWTVAHKQQLATIPQEQRLGWFVREWAILAAAIYSQMEVAETATAWRVRLAHCHDCVGLPVVTTPICNAGTALYAEALREILGVRIAVAEIECVATGDPHCVYEFQKIPGTI